MARLQIQSQPTAPVLPPARAIYELVVVNDAETKEASDDELYVRADTNTDGLRLYIDGEPLVDSMPFNDFEYGSAKLTLEVERGPFLYAYGFRSQCDGYVAEEVDLEVDFLQPCSTVALAGDLHEQGRFLVNHDTMALGDHEGAHKNELRVTVRNPGTDTRRWEDDNRLESVRLEYRRIGAVNWLRALDVLGEAIDFKEVFGRGKAESLGMRGI